MRCFPNASLGLIAIAVCLVAAGCGDPAGPKYKPPTSYGGPGSPVWSPDGSKIAFELDPSRKWDFGIWVVPASGGTARRLTPAGSVVRHPAWSVGGIAFQSGVWPLVEIDPGYAISVVPDSGGTAVAIASGMLAPITGPVPAWSPDGTRLAFSGYSASALGIRIWTAAIADLSISQLTVSTRPGETDCYPAWSSDGAKVVFARSTGSSAAPGLRIVTVAHPDTGQVVCDQGSEPCWSPDGTKIAFSSKRSGNWRIWVVPASGGAPAMITEGPGVDSAPAWHPAGDRILFTSDRSGTIELYTVPPAGGEATRIAFTTSE